MTWLFEEPEGIEFETLPDDKKYDYAIMQVQRKDKNFRWHDIWAAIAWSYNPNKEKRYKIYMER